MKRWPFALAAVASLAVTAAFATVGDGVDVPAATGVRRLIVDAGHTVVWALLCAAFTIAAWRRSWTTASQVLAVSAGITYAAFLYAVLLWP
ncbi:MAG: hypothetical protein IPL41_06520 [Micropruina sp.]|nr:hypothetical protein [Micropruina sp.]